MYQDFETKELKGYKGYQIDKAWWINYEGKKKGNYFYLVSDDDYIGEAYNTLEDAKKFIDSITK